MDKVSRCQWLLIALSLLIHEAIGATESQPRQAPNMQVLSFRVLLDDRDIGIHRFRIEQMAEAETIDIDADFKVTFLGIPFYRYSHKNREVWRNGCLESIRSTTDDNGDQLSVDGRRSAAGFTINTHTIDTHSEQQTSYQLDNSCIMTFAYWNPQFLKQQRLLNAQNGEWLPVDIDFIGIENLDLGESGGRNPGNKPVAAKKYQVRSADNTIDITVWYDRTTHQWLSLTSRVSGDRLLRYLPLAESGVQD